MKTNLKNLVLKKLNKQRFTSLFKKDDARNIVLIFFVSFFIILLIVFSWRINLKHGDLEEAFVNEFYDPEDGDIGVEVEEYKNESCYTGSDEDLGDFWVEIDTDDLQVKSKILEGVSEVELAQGVGHHITTSLPNNETGNVVISGHRWVPEKVPARTVFIDLDKLKIDDEVSLCYQNKKFIYKIKSHTIVDVDKDGAQQGDVNILEQTENPTLTIYTCEPKYPLGTPTKRLVYFGELVK